MSAKHTPGPWRLGRNEHPFSENYLPPAIGTKTREQAMVVFPIEDDEPEPNARLIAAAPDLLAACRAVVSVLGRLPIGDPLISDAHTACKKARAAIAAAEGRNE